MLCPACGSKMNDDERFCKTCGTLLIHGPKVRNETTFNSSSFNAAESGAKKAAEEAAAKKAAEEAAAKKAAEEAAAKRAAEEAEKKAAKRVAEEAEKRVAAKRAAEEAEKRVAAKRAAEEAEKTAAAKRAVEEAEKRAAAKRAAEEAGKRVAAKRAAEEAEKRAAAKRAVEEAEKRAAAKRAAEEAGKRAAAKRAAEEAEERAAEEAEERAAAKKAAEEAAAKRAAEEAKKRVAAKNAAEEAAAVEAAIESAIKSAQETAAKRDAEEAAMKKAAEAAEKKAAEKAEVNFASPSLRLSYKIVGGNFPSISITLDENQSIFTQSDVMVWMSPGFDIETKTKRGVSSFTAIYTSGGYGQEINIASRFPGEIQVLNISGGEVIVQKDAFLAAQPAVVLSSHVSMNMGDEHSASISFQRLSGTGMAFIAISGSLIERVLGPGETIKADTANIAAFEESVSFQTQIISDFQNTVFGEGLFLSTLTGPGKVWLQTLRTYV